MEQIKVKAITNIPGWTNLFQTNKVDNAAEAYAYVPIIYRALRLRCNALAKVPIRIETEGGDEREWPFPVSFYELIWWTEAALLLKGAAYWEKAGNPVGKVKNVVWRNPFSIDVKYKQTEDGKKRQNMIVFEQIEVRGATWTNNLTTGVYEMVYFREFDPTNDIMPGVAAGSVAMTNSQLLRYLSRFAAIFFESGAQPLMVVGFETPPTLQEQQRVENFFTRMATGIKKAWRVLVVRGGLTTANITPPLKDLVIPELYEQARREAADAFEIPLPLLENPANRSVTEELRLSFYQDTVEPRGNFMESIINAQLLKPMGLKLKFMFSEMDIYQEDEADRSQSLNQLTQSGIPLDLAMEVLGFDLSEEQWARLHASMAPKPQLDIDEDGMDAADNPGDALRVDLDKWRRKALKRLRSGKTAACEFESSIIPATEMFRILGSLQDARTVDDVKRIFDAPIPNANGTGNGKGSPTIGELIAELRAVKALAEKPEPIPQHYTFNVRPADVSVTMPERSVEVKAPEMPQVVVNVPEGPAPIVNVAAPDVNIPPIVVNVPEQPPPTVNITNQVETPEVNITNQIDTPEVNVNLPEPDKPGKFTVNRDRYGNITGISEE